MIRPINTAEANRRIVGDFLINGRRKRVYEVRPEGHAGEVAKAVNDATLELITMLCKSQPRLSDLPTDERITLDKHGFHASQTTLSHDHLVDFPTADHLYTQYEAPSEEYGEPPPIDLLTYCTNKDLKDAIAYCRDPDLIDRTSIAQDREMKAYAFAMPLHTVIEKRAYLTSSSLMQTLIM